MGLLDGLSIYGEGESGPFVYPLLRPSSRRSPGVLRGWPGVRSFGTRLPQVRLLALHSAGTRFPEVLAADTSVYVSAPGPFGDRGDTPGWGRWLGLQPGVRRTSDAVPSSLYSHS